jgi:hypothetical protein
LWGNQDARSVPNTHKPITLVRKSFLATDNQFSFILDAGIGGIVGSMQHLSRTIKVSDTKLVVNIAA